MERRLCKLKLGKDGRVSIAFDQRRDGESPWDQFTMSCADAPRPEMASALQDLASDLLDICELPEDYRSGLTIASVTLSYAGDAEVMGAVITGLRALSGARSPLVLNSPYLPSEPSAEDEPCLSALTVNRLANVEGEAFLYVDGDRAQGSLFPKGGA